jgi:hypothetical protein
MSANAAAIEAGFRKVPTVLLRLENVFPILGEGRSYSMSKLNRVWVYACEHLAASEGNWETNMGRCPICVAAGVLPKKLGIGANKCRLEWAQELAEEESDAG